MAVAKIPDGLTVRVSTNARKKTTTIVAYRRGGFKRAYKAIVPMCGEAGCRIATPHTEVTVDGRFRYTRTTLYHLRDVYILISKVAKSYS